MIYPSLHCVPLWFSMIVSIYCEERLLWWTVVATLICECKAGYAWKSSKELCRFSEVALNIQQSLDTVLILWSLHTVCLRTVELGPTNDGENRWHLFFWSYINSPNKIFSSSSIYLTFYDLIFLYSWIVFHWVYVSHSHYLFICWKTFWKSRTRENIP